MFEDTNAPLYVTSFEQIDLQRISGVRHVMPVLLLAVIEYLDSHKNRGGRSQIPQPV
jgi:hypothetical protein